MGRIGADWTVEARAGGARRSLAAILRLVMVWSLRALVSVAAISVGVVGNIQAQLALGASPMGMYTVILITLFAAIFMTTAHEEWRLAKRGSAMFFAILGLVLGGYAMLNSLGGDATLKDALRSRNETARVNLQLDLARRKEVTDEIAQLRKMLGAATPGMIEAKIAELKKDRRFASSGECGTLPGGTITLKQSEQLCKDIEGERGNLAAARRLAELQRKQDGWASKIETAPLSSDPQTEAMATLAKELNVNIPEQSLRAGASAYKVVCYELIGLFGPLAAFAFGRPKPARAGPRWAARIPEILAHDPGQDSTAAEVASALRISAASGHPGILGLHSVSDRPNLLETKGNPAIPAHHGAVMMGQDSALNPDQDLSQELPSDPAAKSGSVLTRGILNEADFLDVKSSLQECVDGNLAGHRTLYADVYDHYRRWCKARGRKPVAKAAFGRALRELGWPDQKDAEPGSRNYKAKVGGVFWLYGAEIRQARMPLRVVAAAE